MFQYFSKNQPNIQRDVEKKCMVCSREFRFGKSEHQCKRCLRAICADCGKQKITLYKAGFVAHPHRGCKHCVEQINGIKQYIKANQLEFGRMSLVGDKWVKKIERTHAYLAEDSRKAGEFKKDVFGKMWDSYNYSMRQFIGLLTFERSQEEVYASVNLVVKTVLGSFPKQNLQSVAYLSIFLLCFCSADKAISLCQYLFELKSKVQSSGGLIDEYLKALGVFKQQKITEYVKYTGLRYISSISVNCAHVNSSIYIIDKVLNRRKIEEVHMYFVLSVDGIKEHILQGKGDFSVMDLYMVRYCNPNLVSLKHRQLSSVNSAAFMKSEEEQIRGRNNSDNNNYEETIIKKEPISPLVKKDKETIRNENQLFQKKYGDFEGSEGVDESMLSMIEEMRELQGSNAGVKEDNNFLASINKKEAKNRISSGNQSAGDSFQVGRVPISPSKTSLSSMSKPSKCKKCSQSNKKVEKLEQELKQYLELAKMVAFYQDQNQKLKQTIFHLQKNAEVNELRETSSRQNKLVLQKTQLDGQIRKLKQNLSEYQSKEKQYENALIRSEQDKRTVQKQEAQIRSLQMQLDESAMTIKMLKNKVQSQGLKVSATSISGDRRESDSTEASVADSKVIDILKQNVKQKNVQIEELTKRNKLLTYQLEDLNKSNKTDRGSEKSSSRGDNVEIEKAALIKKMNELSLLLMNEEGEKLRLSQENFALREILNENRIPIQF